MKREPLLPPALLAIMQCPKCGGELSERAEPPSLVCAKCRSTYRIEEGIPVMLIDEAGSLDDE